MEIHFDETGKALSLPALEALFAAAGLGGRDDGRILRAFRNSHAVCLAWRGEQLVGAARAISDGEYHAFVYDVAVRPDLQGRGVGAELMRRLLARLPVWRVMLRADAEVRGFYRRLGFEVYDEVMARLDPDYFARP